MNKPGAKHFWQSWLYSVDGYLRAILHGSGCGGQEFCRPPVPEPPSRIVKESRIVEPARHTHAGDNLLTVYFQRRHIKTLHEKVAFYKIAERYPLP